jgi:AcrR family transcriptional regulator
MTDVSQGKIREARMVMKTKSTRERILDATQRLIEKDGPLRLTTKQIAREAGCAEGTLFNHFKSKEDLSLAVVLENAPRFRELLSKPRGGLRRVEENFEELAMASIDFFEKLIPLATSLLADIETLKRHRKAMASQERGPKDVFQIIGAYISGEKELNRIGSHVSPAGAAALLLGPCFHRVFMRQVMGKDLMTSTDREFVVELVAALMSGFSPNDDQDSPTTLSRTGLQK